MTNEERRQEWHRDIVKHYARGHYRRALILMAANMGDRGDVMGMIENFCANADPWPEMKGEDDNDVC